MAKTAEKENDFPFIGKITISQDCSDYREEPNRLSYIFKTEAKDWEAFKKQVKYAVQDWTTSDPTSFARSVKETGLDDRHEQGLAADRVQRQDPRRRRRSEVRADDQADRLAEFDHSRIHQADREHGGRGSGLHEGRHDRPEQKREEPVFRHLADQAVHGSARHGGQGIAHRAHAGQEQRQAGQHRGDQQQDFDRRHRCLPFSFHVVYA